MNNKKIVRGCDILFISSLIMFFAMRISVLILFNITAEETGAEIKSIVTVYEANPFFKYMLSLRNIGYVFQFIIIPAVGFTIYFMFRRKVLQNNYPIDTLQFHTIFLFFLILHTFINDVASLIGRLI